MTVDEIKSKLKAAGFREYKIDQTLHHKHAESLCELWVYDSCYDGPAGVKRYAVHAYVYDHGEKAPAGVEFSARFYQSSDRPAFDVDLRFFEDDIQQALVFYADIYKRMGCIPDPHNNP